MSDEVRRQALDPFFTTKTRGLSTGLGLTLVHGVVKAVGGEVEIDSAPGSGTSVVLTVPVADTGMAADPSRRRAWISVRDERVGTFVAALLVSSGFTVDHRDDGAEAYLWIVEPDPVLLEAVRDFLATAPDRTVVVYGTSVEDAWIEAGATVVEPASGMAVLRETIRRAASGNVQVRTLS